MISHDAIRPCAITMGEPSGIGGEISLKAWSHGQPNARPFFVLDSPARLSEISSHLNLNVEIAVISEPSEAAQVFDHALPVLPLKSPIDAVPCLPDPKNATAVIESIKRAFEYAKSGSAAAVVTNPLQKEVLYRANFTHPGHTEYLAHLDGPNVVPVMMLASPMLRVVPVTVHVPLKVALETLNKEMIVEKSKITIAALQRDFNIQRPRIAIAGLNPHAGEQGSLGNDEETTIQPAIQELRRLGTAEITGPVPPDALFTARARQTYDAAICMYHDQALIPIKALDFDHAVNVTLGLSIVRTSPDHGTALDIANQGIADPTSLLAAIEMADEISTLRQNGVTTNNG